MLSIIIPTLNEEKYLPKLLDSIKKQSFRDYEIIVADNNSKDNTRRIAKKYGCRIAKGGLPPVGRNNGAKVAKGKLLLFLDADVVLPKKFLLSCIKEFKKRKLDAATCLFKTSHSNFIDKTIFLFGNFVLFSTQYFDPHGTGAFLLCNKKIFNKVKGFNEKLKQAEDHDFVKRCKKMGKFGVLKKSILVSMRRLKKEGRLKVLKKYAKSELYRKLKGDIDKEIFEYEYGKF